MPYLVGAGDAQYLFDGVRPAHGYSVENKSDKPLWVSDGKAAEPNVGLELMPGDSTEINSEKCGVVTIFGWERGQEFEARSW